MTIQDGVQSLAQSGLNLFAAVPWRILSPKIIRLMAEADVPLNEYYSLVVIGHGGRRLWEAMQPSDWETAEPIDTYSRRKSQRFIETTLHDAKSCFLFPTPYVIPIQQIGQFIGWSHPSPLGQGINPTFGLWFAYRAAFLTVAQLPTITAASTLSPCAQCVTKPCITHCPGDAVSVSKPFDVPACANYRLQPQSGCANRCISRMVCPVSPQHQYNLAQINYHYDLSIRTLKSYFPHLAR